MTTGEGLSAGPWLTVARPRASSSASFAISPTGALTGGRVSTRPTGPVTGPGSNGRPATASIGGASFAFARCHFIYARCRSRYSFGCFARHSLERSVLLFMPHSSVANTPSQALLTFSPPLLTTRPANLPGQQPSLTKYEDYILDSITIPRPWLHLRAHLAVLPSMAVLDNHRPGDSSGGVTVGRRPLHRILAP